VIEVLVFPPFGGCSELRTPLRCARPRPKGQQLAGFEALWPRSGL